MNIIKKIIKVLSKIVTILIIIYALVIFPTIFNYEPLVVLSGSMKPTYDVGSLIYYKAKDNYEVGNSITFTYNNNLVTHRIIEKDNDNFITKGDANSSPDLEPVNIKNIKGKVIINIPLIGYYLKYLNDNKYIIIIMLTILSLDILINTKKRDDTIEI